MAVRPCSGDRHGRDPGGGGLSRPWKPGPVSQRHNMTSGDGATGGEEKQEEEPELGRAHSSLTGMMAAINSELRAGWGF